LAFLVHMRSALKCGEETPTEITSENCEVEQGQRAFSAKRVVIALCVVLVVAAAVAIKQMPVAIHDMTDDALIDLAEAKKKKKKKQKILPKPEECSMAKTQNCMKSQCCENFGFQCYQKNVTYAACLKKCDAKKMVANGNGTWACKELGVRTRCASTKESCLPYGCCADSKHQCYAKNENWGQCMVNCDPSAMESTDKEKWSCAPIGPRNSADYRGDWLPNFAEVEPWVKNCSQLGENCASTKCCSWTGYKCYEKNATWAGCLMGCHPQKWNGGVSQVPLVQKGKPVASPPAHWNVTFTPASPGPWTCKRLAPPSKFGRFNGSSLFCFSVAISDLGGKKKSLDVELLKQAQLLKTHVFACERWMVFSDIVMKLDTNAGGFVKVAFPKGVRRPNTKNYVNLPVFLNVWRALKADTNWKSFPWVVKADPSTVFIPQRLREIVRWQVVTESGVYMENCKYARMGFHGSLEVYSGLAFSKLLAHMEDCQTRLPIHVSDHAHFREYGEDKFAAWCMHLEGVDKIPSRQQVDSLPEDTMIQGLHITVTCPGHRSKFTRTLPKWHPNCTNTKAAGLHAFRKPKLWAKCFQETMQLG